MLKSMWAVSLRVVTTAFAKGDSLVGPYKLK